MLAVKEDKSSQRERPTLCGEVRVSESWLAAAAAAAAAVRVTLPAG